MKNVALMPSLLINIQLHNLCKISLNTNNYWKISSTILFFPKFMIGRTDKCIYVFFLVQKEPWSINSSPFAAMGDVVTGCELHVS